MLWLWFSTCAFDFLEGSAKVTKKNSVLVRRLQVITQESDFYCKCYRGAKMQTELKPC